MIKRDVGRLGEATFEQWCNQVDLVANKSIVDKYGWDYRVETEKQADENIPLDISNTYCEYVFQIKSTDRKTKKIQIRLSNIARLAKSPLPCFYHILEFESKNNPVNAYLIHVDKRLIERVLRRLRKISKDQNKSPHKSYITLTYDAENLISPLNGTGLRRKINSYIQNDFAAYIDHKMDLIKSVGYEYGVKQINFNTELPEEYLDSPAEYLVDFALGIIDELPMNDLRLFDIRFGVPIPELKTPTSGGTLEIINRDSFGDSFLKFKCEKNSREVILRAKSFFAHGIPKEIFQNYPKFRFTTQFMNFIFDENLKKCSINFQFPKYYDKVSLKDFISLADVYSYLFQNGAADIITEVEVVYNSKLILSGKLAPEVFPEDEYPNYKLMKTLRALWKLLTYFDIDPSRITTSFSEIIPQKVGIDTLFNIAFNQPMKFKISFKTVHRIVDRKDLVIPLLTELRIDSKIIVIGFGFFGERSFQKVVNSETFEYFLEPSNIQILDFMILDKNKIKEFDSDIFFDNLVENIENSDNVAILLFEGYHFEFNKPKL